MAKAIIPETRAEATFLQLADEEGRLILLPAATVQALVAKGLTSLATTIGLVPGESKLAWVTPSQAARMLVDEDIVPDLDLKQAKDRVSYACDKGRLRHRGLARRREIDPQSLRSWMMDLRAEELRRDSERGR